MRVLVIDNYDSFTYNLAQAMQCLGAEVLVHRNDAIQLDDIEQLVSSHLVVSPGPGRPEDAGISVAAIRRFLGTLPILGVCLGHQSLAYALGGTIQAARDLLHGEPSEISHDGAGLFAGLSGQLTAGRYHSLAVEEASLPPTLKVCARSADGEIMALRHRQLNGFGVQFHPESILTPRGPALLNNFLGMSGGAS
jgi:anthranilate synthase/aminodeoxychorismate synthase-like glutamine amidotransferase